MHNREEFVKRNFLTSDIRYNIILTMSKAEKLLERMRNNPRDWQIDTLISIAEKHGIEIRNCGGSHYVFSHPDTPLNVSVPAHKPIKSVYIKQFLELVDTVKGENEK